MKEEGQGEEEEQRAVSFGEDVPVPNSIARYCWPVMVKKKGVQVLCTSTVCSLESAMERAVHRRDDGEGIVIVVSECGRVHILGE